MVGWRVAAEAVWRCVPFDRSNMFEHGSVRPQALAAKYPAMFSPSLACKPPHLNQDSLRDKLFQVDAMGAHGLRTDAELLDWHEGRPRGTRG